MARVDFYVLSQPGEACRRLFACRLAEKAYRLSNTVHIHLASRQDAEQLDDLLWTFRDGSFVPHELLASDPGSAEAPVTIGFDRAAMRRGDLLINLSPGQPAAADAFPRIAEIVSADDDCRRRGRKLFAEYRSGGHSLNTHNV